ncbi:MAG: serine/threonine protein kinase, partial [Pirellulaceae bacterium]
AAAVDLPAAASMPEITIDGYEIVRELGRGGMGVVYLANDVRLKRSVALKVILTGEHSSWEQRERFRVEAETIAQLRHSGIVQIYEVGEHDGHVYFALELIEGGGLQEFINDQPQGIAWSAAVVLQLAATMYFAHQQGIVHRDLKPANVLLELTEDANDSGSFAWQDSSWSEALVNVADIPIVKVTDFGLAKQLDSDSNLTKTGLVMGTPAYMAPEQANVTERGIGPAADIHAIGAILYKLLTGRPPFESDDVIQTLMMVVNDDPLSPRTFRADIPRDLETICLKCLHKRPEDRYKTAFDLATDLKLFLQGEPIQSRPLGIGGRILRWARQKPTLATTLSAGSLFYVIHLVMWCGGADNHVDLHNTVTVVMAGWLVCAFIIQRFIDDPRWSVYGKYAFTTLSMLTVSGLLMLDRGPTSAPIQIFLLLQAASLLVVPTTRMVGLSTIAAAVGYATLIVHAHFFLPQEYQVGFEAGAAFLVSIAAMGLIMFLILRRSKQQSKGNGIPSSSIFGPRQSR